MWNRTSPLAHATSLLRVDVEFHGDLRLVAAAYYAGDRSIARKQLDYRNPDVVSYVRGGPQAVHASQVSGRKAVSNT